MSGYWQAIAAAARGGAKGRGDAAPVPADPLFAPEAGGEGEDWGAIDIEAAVPVAPEPREATPVQDAPSSKTASKGQGPVDAPAAAAVPVAPPTIADRTDRGEREERAPHILSGEMPAVPASVAAEPVEAFPPREGPAPVADDREAPPAPAAVTVSEAVPVTLAIQAADNDVEGTAESAAPLPEAAPVVVTVEALPAVVAAEPGLTMFDDRAVDAPADLPPPIHIHIDRIDIRLAEGDAAPARAAPRRAAPVVALDEFLRRPSERNG